ncbi:MAG: sugar nucleotide-binding protein [Candidatus Fermentibacteraceae bacterium]
MVITGATGRVGSVVRCRAEERFRVRALSAGGESGTEALDLCSPGAADAVLSCSADLVINCAALSTGGACRADPAGAFALNALWPARLGDACARRRVPLVHLSTDLVWSGATPPYRETSPAVPLSLYGWTKLLGDVHLLRRYPEALVARTSVVFGPSPSKASTFSEAVLAGEVPAFFTDSWRNHTPVSWLAETLLDLAERGASGLFLVSARWEQTRSAFAEALLEHMGLDAPDLPLAYRPSGVPETLALRPQRLERVLGQTAPDLRESLQLEYPQSPGDGD